MADENGPEGALRAFRRALHAALDRRADALWLVEVYAIRRQSEKPYTEGDQSMTNMVSGTGRLRAGRTEILGASPISDRETEVLLLAARGLSNREIAERLHLVEATVKRHLANVYPKLGVRSRGQATCEALHRGLISAEELTGGEGR